jgi:hypothetical protein
MNETSIDNCLPGEPLQILETKKGCIVERKEICRHILGTVHGVAITSLLQDGVSERNSDPTPPRHC